MSASQDLQEADPRSFISYPAKMKPSETIVSPHRECTVTVLNAQMKHTVKKSCDQLKLLSNPGTSAHPRAFPKAVMFDRFVCLRALMDGERRGGGVLAVQAPNLTSMMVVLSKEAPSLSNERAQTWTSFHNVPKHMTVPEKNRPSKGSRSRLSWWHCRRDKEES